MRLGDVTMDEIMGGGAIASTATTTATTTTTTTATRTTTPKATRTATTATAITTTTRTTEATTRTTTVATTTTAMRDGTVADFCMDPPLDNNPCPAFIHPVCESNYRAGDSGRVVTLPDSGKNATISCKAVLKDEMYYDMGAVENMIQSGVLPLNILHVGPGGA